MINNKETCDLARILLISSSKYVVARIENSKNKLAYARAAGRCEQIMSNKESGDDLVLMKQKLMTLRYNLSLHSKKRWFNRESEYYAMAVQQAIEVIDSVLTRFVEGYVRDNNILSASILEGSHDGHQICACLARFGQTKG